MGNMTWEVKGVNEEDGNVNIAIYEDGKPDPIYVHNMTITDVNNAKAEIQQHCDDIYTKILASRTEKPKSPLNSLMGLTN